MQSSFDTQEVMERAGELAQKVRRSEAYPALLGGVAGGIAGAFVAVIIAGRAPQRRDVGAAPLQSPVGPADAARALSGGLALKEILQLLTVAAGLLRQMQVWMRDRDKPLG